MRLSSNYSIFSFSTFSQTYSRKKLEDQKIKASQQTEGKTISVLLIIGLVVLMSLNSLIVQEKENKPKNALNKSNELLTHS